MFHKCSLVPSSSHPPHSLEQSFPNPRMSITIHPISSSFSDSCSPSLENISLFPLPPFGEKNVDPVYQRGVVIHDCWGRQSCKAENQVGTNRIIITNSDEKSPKNPKVRLESPHELSFTSSNVTRPIAQEPASKINESLP